MSLGTRAERASSLSGCHISVITLPPGTWDSSPSHWEKDTCDVVEIRNFYMLHLTVHLESFLMEEIWFLHRKGVFKLIQDHSTNELRQQTRLAPTQDSCNSLNYTFICLRFFFPVIVNRRGTQNIYGDFKFHILIEFSEHHSISVKSSTRKNIFTWFLRKVEYNTSEGIDYVTWESSNNCGLSGRMKHPLASCSKQQWRRG